MNGKDMLANGWCEINEVRCPQIRLPLSIPRYYNIPTKHEEIMLRVGFFILVMVLNDIFVILSGFVLWWDILNFTIGRSP